MPKTLLCQLIASLLLLIATMAASNVQADNCERLEQQAKQLAQKRRSGGTAKQMANWKAQQTRVNEARRRCQQNTNAIQVARNTSKTTSSRAAREKPLTSQSTNPQVQQLFITCNQWITRHNQQPTPENHAFKESACRHARQAEQAPTQVAHNERAQRSLAQCIKPGNVIDKDVTACMKGEINADWREPPETAAVQQDIAD